MIEYFFVIPAVIFFCWGLYGHYAVGKIWKLVGKQEGLPKEERLQWVGKTVSGGEAVLFTEIEGREEYENSRFYIIDNSDGLLMMCVSFDKVYYKDASNMFSFIAQRCVDSFQHGVKLNQQQIKEMILYLQRFIDTGKVMPPEHIRKEHESLKVKMKELEEGREEVKAALLAFEEKHNDIINPKGA